MEQLLRHLSFQLVVKWRLQSIKTQTESARAQMSESGVSQEPAGKVLLGNGERDPLSPPTAFFVLKSTPAPLW